MHRHLWTTQKATIRSISDGATGPGLNYPIPLKNLLRSAAWDAARVPNSLHLCQETRLERKWKRHSWSTPKQFQQTARRGDKNEAIIVLDVPMDPLGVYSREHQAWPQNSVIGSTHFGGATPNFHPCEIDLRHPQESQKFLITMLCSDLGKQQNS